jgi:zinc transporter
MDGAAATTTAPSGDQDDRKTVVGAPPGLVWAYRFHEDGSAEALAPDQPIDDIHDGWLWLHFNLTDTRVIPWLQRSGIPDEATTLMRSHSRHQQLHSVGNCVYGLFTDLRRQLDGTDDEFGHLHFAMTDRLLASGRHHRLAAVETAREKIARGERRVPHMAALLELIVEHVAEAVDGLVDDLGRELDEIEEGLALDAPRDERNRLGRARRTAMRVHRQLTGLRAAFRRLDREEVDPAILPLRAGAVRLAQRLDSLDHAILDTQSRARLLQEEVTQSLAEETNRHLHALSVLTVMLLPPTFITGVYGMNVKGIPFADFDNGFPWVAGLMVAAAGVTYLVMRRLGILR